MKILKKIIALRRRKVKIILPAGLIDRIEVPGVISCAPIKVHYGDDGEECEEGG